MPVLQKPDGGQAGHGLRRRGTHPSGCCLEAPLQWMYAAGGQVDWEKVENISLTPGNRPNGDEMIGSSSL